MESTVKKSVKIETLEYTGDLYIKCVSDFVTEIAKKTLASVFLEHDISGEIEVEVILETKEGWDPIFIRFSENNECVSKLEEIKSLTYDRISKNINGIKIPGYNSIFQFMSSISPYFTTMRKELIVDTNEYTLEGGTDDNNK